MRLMPMCGSMEDAPDLEEVMHRLNIDIKDILITPKPTRFFERKEVDSELREFVFIDQLYNGRWEFDKEEV